MNDENSEIHAFEDAHGLVVRVQCLNSETHHVHRAMRIAGYELLHSYPPSQWERFA